MSHCEFTLVELLKFVFSEHQQEWNSDLTAGGICPEKKKSRVSRDSNISRVDLETTTQYKNDSPLSSLTKGPGNQ